MDVLGLFWDVLVDRRRTKIKKMMSINVFCFLSVSHVVVINDESRTSFQISNYYEKHQILVPNFSRWKL